MVGTGKRLQERRSGIKKGVTRFGSLFLFTIAAKSHGQKARLFPALEAIGIDNPIVEIGGGKKRHKYTPHSCRHTFATLLKRVAGADKDKQELIGHASA